MTLGVLGSCAAGIDLFRNWASDGFASAIDSDFIALFFCIAAASAGCGIFRYRRWARVLCAVVGVVLLFYTISYFLMVGLEFCVFSFVLICTAAVFSVYSLFAIGRFGQAL
jgi:hypothetical protein